LRKGFNMAFARSIKSDQRLMRMMSVKLDGTGTAALSGSSYLSMTLTDNGTGDYTLTFDEAFQRAPEVHVSIAQAAGVHAVVSAVSVSACTIKTFAAADGTTAADADMHVLIVGSDAADAI
jgi:hypothetical protein